MKNNVLIKLIIPEINEAFDIFIPVNQQIWKIKNAIIKAIGEIEDEVLDFNKKYYIIDKESGQIFNDNDVIINTKVRNVSELLLISDTNMIKGS